MKYDMLVLDDCLTVLLPVLSLGESSGEGTAVDSPDATTLDAFEADMSSGVGMLNFLLVDRILCFMHGEDV